MLKISHGFQFSSYKNIRFWKFIVCRGSYQSHFNQWYNISNLLCSSNNNAIIALCNV